MVEKDNLGAEKRKVFGYLRVSTDNQSSGLESQARALKDYFSKNGIYEYELFSDENVSGAKTSRPGLNRMMEAVERDEASQVVVFSFSRFARSTTHLLNTLSKLKEKNVRFISITEAVDTESPMGLALFTILGALSQMEREILSQRVKAGLINARAKGKKLGRKKTRPSEVIRALLRKGTLTYRQISEIAGCSHGSIAQEKKEMLAEQKKLDDKIKQTQSSESKPKLTIV